MPELNDIYEVIVIGLGGIGSAATYALSKEGKKILGIEQYSQCHPKGSSHGKSRIVRHGYYSNRDTYMPLLLRAKQLWDNLEKETKIKIQYEHGGLSLGQEGSTFIQGSLLCAQEYGLNIEKLDAFEIRKRYPQFQAPDNFIAVLDKTAYTLDPEAAIKAHTQLAIKNGAELHYNEKVMSWDMLVDDRIVVTTNQNTYITKRLILTAGPWTTQIAGCSLPLNVQRTVSYWFDPITDVEIFDSQNLPNYIWYFDDNNIFYGFPHLSDHGRAVKVGLHYQRADCHPDNISREVTEMEIAEMKAFLQQYVPSLAGRCVYAQTCMYTMTPDENFIIGHHPDCKQVFIAAGFSGHGYRFASVIGEVLSDLALKGATLYPIEIFSPQRFIMSPLTAYL